MCGKVEPDILELFIFKKRSGKEFSSDLKKPFAEPYYFHNYEGAHRLAESAISLSFGACSSQKRLKEVSSPTDLPD